jgi:hypothetical protein
VGLILATCVVTYAEDLIINPNLYPIVVDGIVQDIEAYNINGYTFIKLSQVGLATGALAEFNTEKQQIEITTDFLNEQTVGGDVTMDGWITLRDLVEKYSVKINVSGAQEKIRMEKGSILVLIDETKPYNEIRQIQTSYGEISIQVKDDGKSRITYFKIVDLQAIGLID